MKVRATILFIFQFLVTVAIAQEPRIRESVTMYSEVLGQDIRYSIVLPENYYGEERSYPVVYLLHGLGDDETGWLEYGRISQYADEAVEAGNIVPMIFVIPQGFRTYYVNDYTGTFLYQDMFVKELVPTIDRRYRTLADRDHRATMGYSMGGFGALILPLKHPSLFRTCVPLSISIRTDEQYMVEDAAEWDQQWGRLFGGMGTIGQERITAYFKQNYPFHIFLEEDLSKFSDLNIYIDNGDDEHTLCRSNEELHILMRNKGIDHEFRVRDGGHSFGYWRSSLPNALRFISDAFTGSAYRGDLKKEKAAGPTGIPDLQKIDTHGMMISAYVPKEYDLTDRRYPVIYFAGDLSPEQCGSVASVAEKMIEDNEIGPVILVFLSGDAGDDFSKTILHLEKSLRIRTGYRFRSIAGYREMAQEALELATGAEKFSSCLLIDGYLQKGNIEALLSSMDKEALRNTPIFVDAPDKGAYYEGNGVLHMMMRDRELKHEYRVRDGSGGFEWCLENMEELFRFTDYNFHR